MLNTRFNRCAHVTELTRRTADFDDRRSSEGTGAGMCPVNQCDRARLRCGVVTAGGQIEFLSSEHWGGAVKVRASIEDPAVLKTILDPLVRRAEAATPLFRPFVRAPPQQALPGLKRPGRQQTLL